MKRYTPYSSPSPAYNIPTPTPLTPYSHPHPSYQTHSPCRLHSETCQSPNSRPKPHVINHLRYVYRPPWQSASRGDFEAGEMKYGKFWSCLWERRQREPLHFADTGTTRAGRRGFEAEKVKKPGREAEVDAASRERLFQVIATKEKFGEYCTRK